MGKTHSTSGITLALGYTALALPLAPTAWPEILTFAVVTAGTAMWPDWDHPSATAANSWGPASRAVSRLVVAVCGPHRHGAHSVLTAGFLGVVVAGASVWLADRVPLLSLLPIVLVFLAASLSIGVLWKSKGPLNEALGAALAAAVYFGEVDASWLPVAVTLGCLAHIAGDALTDKPQKMFWPISDRMIPSLGLFKTGMQPGRVGEPVFFWSLRIANVVLVLVVAGLWGPTVAAGQEAWPYVAEAARQATGVGA